MGTYTFNAKKEIMILICHGGSTTFLAWIFRRKTLTTLIELEGAMAGINCHRDGPHLSHCLHKGFLVSWDLHKVSDISPRDLSMVPALSTLLKLRRKKFIHGCPPPREDELEP